MAIDYQVLRARVIANMLAFEQSGPPDSHVCVTTGDARLAYHRALKAIDAGSPEAPRLATRAIRFGNSWLRWVPDPDAVAREARREQWLAAQTEDRG